MHGWHFTTDVPTRVPFVYLQSTIGIFLSLKSLFKNDSTLLDLNYSCNKYICFKGKYKCNSNEKRETKELSDSDFNSASAIGKYSCVG